MHTVYYAGQEGIPWSRSNKQKIENLKVKKQTSLLQSTSSSPPLPSSSPPSPSPSTSQLSLPLSLPVSSVLCEKVIIYSEGAWCHNASRGDRRPSLKKERTTTRRRPRHNIYSPFTFRNQPLCKRKRGFRIEQIGGALIIMDKGRGVGQGYKGDCTSEPITFWVGLCLRA